MYITKEELIDIIEEQIERDIILVSNCSKINSNDELEEIRDNLINGVRVSLKLIIYILNNESSFKGNQLKYMSKNNRTTESIYLNHCLSRINFTLRELNKMKLRTEYKEMIE